MELKPPKAEYRIIFLHKFTQELILSLLKEAQIEKKIEIEKLKMEFLEPQISPEQAFRKIIRTPVVPVRVSEKSKVRIPKQDFSVQNLVKKPVIRRYPHRFPLNKIKSKLREQPSAIYPNEPSPLQTFELELQPRPEGFNLGKVDLLLKDPLIKSIECEGSDKELIVKKNGRIYKTQVIMNQTEIKDVLDSFSRQARIPVIGGFFRAAVGDLMISAVISETVGSKFVITKMSKYSLLKQK